MRYQERIYIQNDNYAVRNKDILNVNMSSDLSIFQQPKFILSGATKVQCDSIILSADTSNFQEFVLDAYANCFGLTEINPHCYSETDFVTNIYTNNNLIYSGNMFTDYVFSGIPTDNQVGAGLASIFNTLGYAFTYTGTTFDIDKPYGVHELRVDLTISFGLEGLGVCAAGFTPNTYQDGCTQINSIPTVFSGYGPTIVTGNTFSGYSNYGAYFYPEISTLGPYPLLYDDGLRNADYTLINPICISNSANTNSFWWNSGNTTDGRLNSVGLSAITDSSATKFVGFSQCINVVSADTYYVGIAADNLCKIYVNGELLIYLSNSGSIEDFFKWSVFPILLKEGKNIIEVLGNNHDNITSFGAEIYYPTSYATLTAATSTDSLQANAIFSTENLIGSYFTLTENLPFGYSCPSGYSLDLCNEHHKCTQILRTDYTLPCSGNCSGSASTIADGFFPYINNSSQGVYIVDGGINTIALIPLTFNFTANTDSFTATTTTFNYKIYKYNPTLNLFTIPPVYESDDISYSAFSGSNQLNVTIPLSGLSLDGDYLVKGYFKSVAETDFLGRLGKILNTYDYNKGSAFQLYDQYLDYYFIAISKADTPLFTQSPVSGNTVSNSLPLYQQVILVDDSSNILVGTSGSTFTLSNTYVGDIFVTLNGLVLSKDYDYTLNGQTLIFLGTIHIGDIISIVYTKTPSQTLISDGISINTIIPSGSTNSQGTYKYFYNTTTNKYEIFTQRVPIINSNIIVILNGVTLSNNIDYYQSTTNQNRIILEGTIMIGDMITIIYYPQASVINGINQNSNIIKWYIPNQQNNTNGSFILQYSSTPTFSSYTISDTVIYQPYVTSYSGLLTLSGSAGTTWYYRVENKKEYVSICGDLIESIAYSEIIPVVIQTNAVNSY